MSKICPECKAVVDDNHAAFCPSCGSRLVEMEIPAPTLNIGDANAISGGVNINQSKNITSHDTHFHSTTVHERSKSETELKLDANNQLRAKAEGIMAERGRIDSIAMGQLRPLALQLGIDDETFKSIIKDVRSNRNGSASGLSAANARYLQQAQQAVQTNDMDALSNLKPRLEAMAAISLDDNVQYLYYLTLCLLYPLKSMEVYERQTDENYWRTFWAIISYIRTGKYEEANGLLALFDPLRYEKSEDDQNLLEAYFNFMKENKDDAQEFLDEILGEPSVQIKPLHRAIELTLYEEEAESSEVRFYMEHVMTKSNVIVKSQKNAEPSVSVEEPSKKALKQKATNKDNKEADELYSKACAASGGKRVMLLQKAADAGSLEAMFDLADCYADGEGVKKDMPLAIKWLTKAADAGYVKAQLGLAGAYFTGEEGLDQSYSLAEKYLLMAAEKGNTEAQGVLSQVYVGMEDYDKALVWARKASQMEDATACSVLGHLFDEGLGVDVDYAEAFKWHKKAAELGDTDEMCMLGLCYSEGSGVEQDHAEAFKWFKKAAELGNVDGMGHVGLCYLNGEGVGANIKEAEEWLQKAADGGVEEAKKMLDEIRNSNFQTFDDEFELQKAKDAFDNEDYETALNIWRPLAERNIPEAIRKIGLCYYQGHGVALDVSEAVKWFKKAIELEDAQAMTNLGNCYMNGQGVTKNPKEAFKWYKKAAELENANGMYCLGNCYYDGQGITKNQKEAFKWYKKAAELGNANGMRCLGRAYELGQGITKNHKEAIKWLKKAAKLDDVLAMRFLGLSMKHENEYEEAIKWYKKAAGLGDVISMAELSKLYFETTIKTDEAAKWAQKALDNGYEDTDGEIQNIVEMPNAPIPEVIFEKGWVTQENEQTIGLHFSLRVTNLKGQIVTFRCTTKTSSDVIISGVTNNLVQDHSEKTKPLKWDDTQWTDWNHFLYEPEIKNNLDYKSYPIMLKTVLSVFDSHDNCLGSYRIGYSVIHELRLLHPNRLLLANR